MTALYIILGIIVFFALLLSIPAVVKFEYTDSVKLSVSWLFLKFDIFPVKEKKKKKKNKKEKKPEKKKEEEKPKKEPTEKKENFLKTFYNNQGVSGILELVSNCASALGKLSKGFIHSLFIRKLHIDISITESDAAATAIKYGEVCAELYPPLGYICSVMHVKNYKVNIWANYCGEKTVGQFKTQINIIPLILINAAIAFAFRMLGQLIKVMRANAKADSDNKKSETKGGKQ